ncbi:MAG: 50S ribosomal protein L25 [Gemmatimonadales bacterium]
MAHTVQLAAERRTPGGKGAARQTRIAGRIPAVIYGHGRTPESLSLSRAEFDRVVAAGAHETTIFDLAIDGIQTNALVREVQRHPYKKEIMHVDFLEIHAGEALTLSVPIRLIGIPDGVRNMGGTLDQVLREIEIRILPKDIPDHIEVDVTALKVHESVHVRDIVVPNAEILQDADATICTVSAARVEEVVAPTAEAAVVAEPEVIGKVKEPGEDEAEADEKD